MPTTSRAATLAQQLLDAQVRHHLDRLHGDRLAPTVEGLAGSLLDAGGGHQIGDLMDRGAIKDIVSRSLATVPSSAAVGAIVELAVQVVRDGPEQAYPLGEVVDRDQLEVLLDEVLALSPVLERALERLTASPLVGTMASRFMGRVVAEVLQANKTVADKVPGLGSLMSFGTNAATRMVGAADKQLEGLIGDTVGKGGTFAVRRLNRILIETLRDPTTREAVLQVWDLLAQEPIGGLAEHVTPDEVAGVVDAAHDLAISTLAHDRLTELTDAVVEAFFERFGGYTPVELLDQLDLDRTDVIADLVRIAPGILTLLEESGELDRLLREQLAPFYDSEEVRALLR